MRNEQIVINKLNKHTLSIKVKVSKLFTIRIFFARILFSLGSRILGCVPELEFKDEEDI